MSWIQAADPTRPPLEAVLSHRPELRDLYKRFYGGLWEESDVPRDLLELCRLRIAQLHACDAELAVRDGQSGVTDEQVAALEGWRTSDLFTPGQQAALALAEKMPWEHHQIEDAEFNRLREFLSEKEAVGLTLGMALFDAICRLRLFFEVEPSPSTVAASSAGPLH